MAVRTKHSGRAMAMPAGIGVGTGISMVLTLGMSAVLAAMVLSGNAGENAVGFGAIVILLVSAFCGSFVSAAVVKHRRLLVCALTGAAYYITLLCCTALFFDGQYSGMGVAGLVILAGVGISAMLGLVGENRGAGRRRKYKAW